jgi:segregation and condensation protein B
MELSEIIPHIEALIFASEKPLTSVEIVELINNAFGFMEERVSSVQIDRCIEGIREKYDSEFYPFEIRESGGGWQFLTKKEFHKTIIQLNGDKFLKRLSNAALETLAIIAYKQPITKGEVESIRGVNSDYSVQKLLEKELIIITGRNEKLPGHPIVYTTSKTFMDYFGINTTEDLPKIREVLAEQFIDGTLIDAADFTSNTDITALPDNSDENEEVIIVEESEETVGVEDVKDKEGEILQAIEEKLITVHRDGEGNIGVEDLRSEEEGISLATEDESTTDDLNADENNIAEVQQENEGTSITKEKSTTDTQHDEGTNIDEDIPTDEEERTSITEEKPTTDTQHDEGIKIEEELPTEKEEISLIIEEESIDIDPNGDRTTNDDDTETSEQKIAPTKE